MWPFSKKEDFIVFLPLPKSKFQVLRIDAKTTISALEEKVAYQGELRDKTFAEIAYMRISFKQATTPQEAANIAKQGNLVYIPPLFIQALRERHKEMDILAIRQEFAKRSKEYQSSQRLENYSRGDWEATLEILDRAISGQYETHRIKKDHHHSP